MYLKRLVVICIILLIGVSVVQAGDGNMNFTLDCRGFRSSGGSLALNRDNTGNQQEAFIISAIDGLGQTIYEPSFDVFFVGTTVSLESGVGDFWTSAPRFNPLVLQVVSPAGNGMEEQIVEHVVGNCSGLQTIDPLDLLSAFTREAVRQLTGEAFVLLPADGVTGDPLALNTAPPRPINPPGLARMQPGWAVVNTDNLNLRSGDSPFHEVIAVLDGGTELVVLGRNDDRTWWYVQVGGIRGWSSGEFLVMRGDLTDVPVVPATGELARPRLYIGFTGNPAYALPLIGSVALCNLPGDLDYEIVGRTSNAAWFEIMVTCDGEETTGWVPAEFGAFRNPGNLRVPVTF